MASLAIVTACNTQTPRTDRTPETTATVTPTTPPPATSVSVTPPAAAKPAPSSTPTPADVFLERQTAALLPAFQPDLADLAAAPRYTIDATVDLEARTVDGRLTLRYTNPTDEPLSELVFRLYPNAGMIYGGGNLSVDDATHAGTPTALELSPDRTVMHVPLDPPLTAGGTTSISLTFAAKIPVNTRQGYGIFNQALGVTSLAGWYPILAVHENGWQTPDVPQVGDALWAETSLYDVHLTVPRDVTVVSTGVTVAQEEDGGATTWHVVSGPARDFTVAISDRFTRQHTDVSGVTVNYYTLPASSPHTSAEDTFAMITDAFAAYVEHFGPYSLRELDVVEVVVPIGGYEFSGMVYVDHDLRTDGAFTSLRYIVGHEVAHEWWYGLVGNNSVQAPWLDESLVSYAAVIYLEDAVGDAAAEELIAIWKQIYGLPAPGDPPVNSSASAFSSWPAYRESVYYHGALFLDTLRQELGDQAFFELLQRYAVTYRYASATTTDFLELAETVAGRDLDELFRPWFDIPSSSP